MHLCSPGLDGKGIIQKALTGKGIFCDKTLRELQGVGGVIFT